MQLHLNVHSFYFHSLDETGKQFFERKGVNIFLTINFNIRGAFNL